MRTDRRFYYFDYVSFFVALSLCCIGLLFVFSATYRSDAIFSLFFKKQVFGIISGFCIYGICAIIDYRTSMRTGYFGYFILIGLLIFTLIKGSIGMGAQRWINLGLFKLQPSELAKILFPAFVAHYLHGTINPLHLHFKTFVPILTALFVGVPLIAKQPDLGTALLVLFSGLTLCWIAGLSRRFFIILLCIGICSLPIAHVVLKQYQLQRILVFLGYGSAQKERYQIEQAHIAIGSGGLTGKGFLHGTQNKLHFLPEGRTDFIFAVLCEEWGLVGALCVIMLYCILFFRILSIIRSLNNHTMQLFATGLILHIMFSTIINIGMVLGLLPVVGIPLPFMSYGISNLWVNLVSLGIIQNIFMHRVYRKDL